MGKSKEKILWDKTGSQHDGGAVRLGPYTSYQFKNTPRHILFSLSRYKFAQKMIGSKKKILELGCNEGLGCHYLAEFAELVCGVDFDERAIEWAKNNNYSSNLTFISDDCLNKKYGRYDALVSYDVIEHIYPENERHFVQTIVDNLSDSGIALVGTPNSEADRFSNSQNAEGHVNLFDGDRLHRLLLEYFNNVFLFSVNDEMVHTGFSKMAHYLIALCVYPKKG